MTTVIGPGSWVRCVRRAVASEFSVGNIYKVVSIHPMSGPCNGPPDHQCREIAYVLAGVTYPSCSQCFAPVKPGGPAFMAMLLNAKAPTQILPRNSE